MNLAQEQWRDPSLYPQGCTYSTFTFPNTVAAIPGVENNRDVTIYYQNCYIKQTCELIGIQILTTNHTTATYRRWKFGVFKTTPNGGIGDEIASLPYSEVNRMFNPRNPAPGSNVRLPIYMLPNPLMLYSGWHWIGFMLEHVYTGETALTCQGAYPGQYRMDLGGYSMQGDVRVTNTTTNISTANWANSTDGSGYTNSSNQPNLGLVIGEII